MVDVAGGAPALVEASSAQNPFFFVGPYTVPKRCDTATPKNFSLKRLYERQVKADDSAFSLQAQRDDFQLSFLAGQDLTLFLQQQLIKQKMSQELIMLSSAAPTSNNIMSAIYKTSKNDETPPALHLLVDGGSLKYLKDQAHSSTGARHSDNGSQPANANFANRGQTNNQVHGQIIQEFHMPAPSGDPSSEEYELHPEIAPSAPLTNANDEFDYKPGGEIGEGLLSSSRLTDQQLNDYDTLSKKEDQIVKGK